MSTWDPTAPRRWVVARTVRMVVGKTAWAALRVKMLHFDRVPKEGAAILAGNHNSYVDPVLMGTAMTRRIHYMAKAELWENKALGWICQQLYAFPVKRGEADRQAITTATRILQSGQLLGIFPEGTRGGGEMHSGMAFLAMRANVPVIPVGMYGTDRIMPKGSKFIHLPRVRIAFGEPIHPEQFAGIADRKERMAAMSMAVEAGIAAALQEAKEA